MRFLAWRILGWILKEASMASAACLFQKDGSSSSTGTVQTDLSPSSPACASLGHPRDTCSLGTPMLDPPLTWTKWFRGLFGVQACTDCLAPRSRGGEEGGTAKPDMMRSYLVNGMGPNPWQGVLVEDTGTFSRPAPSREASENLGENWFQNPRRAGVINLH